MKENKKLNFKTLNYYLEKNIKALMEDFFLYLNQEKIQIYNEFNIQHELGIFLRFYCRETKDYKIEFERNIDDLNLIYKDKIKKEIDIYITNGKKQYAIELKYPSIKKDKNGTFRPNGAFNQAMYECIRDIKFMETLTVENNFKTFSIVIVNSIASNFYDWPIDRNNKAHEIYSYFRGSRDGKKSGFVSIPVNKSIKYPNKNNDRSIKLEGKNNKKKEYTAEWKPWNIGKLNGKYYIIEL